MRRIVLLIVLLGGAGLGYRYYAKSYAPTEHYKRFAEAILHRQYDRAAEMASGLTADQLQQSGSQEHVGPGPEMFQTLFASRFNVESCETAADGVVTVHATQTVLFNPVGVESTRPAMYALMKQTAGLRKGDGGWKVTSFDNKFEKMDSMSGR